MKKTITTSLFLLQLFSLHSLCAAITFSFTQEVRFFQSPNPDLDFLLGDTFAGTFTFDPSTSGAPVAGGYVHYASAVTSWSVSFARLGLTFSGSAGDIHVGNDTPFYLSDRYVVTLFNQGFSNPLFPSGRSLRFVQLDLFDIEGVFNPPPADLFADSLLPTTPPDLSRITSATQGSATGKVYFNENNNQLQTRLTSLGLKSEPAVVPEPGSLFVGILLLVPCVQRMISRKR